MPVSKSLGLIILEKKAHAAGLFVPAIDSQLLTKRRGADGDHKYNFYS
jgi:hypothetical protein